MSFTGTVENGVIKLPPGVHLRDGLKVTVVPAESEPASAEPPTLFEAFAPFIGCIKTEETDIAENHDYYAHGAPKGIDRL
jgi:predicted DNA-binding antitoxin AbrB/MazE fold protein